MNTNKTWALYERRYGTLYEDTKHLSVKEVAAHMRKVIRQAAKDGVLPKNWNYQVRYRAYAGGCAIDVNVGIPDELYALRQKFVDEFGFTNRGTVNEFMTGEYEPLRAATEAEQLLNQIHRGYNFDGSDPMTDYFDVRYYGTVTIMANARYGMFFGKVK